MGKTTDILLKAFEDEKLVLRKSLSKMDSVVSHLRSDVTSVNKQTKEVVEKKENRTLRLEQQVMDLSRKNDILRKTLKCSSIQDKINSNSESLVGLNEQCVTLGHTVNNVSQSLQKIADDFGDHESRFIASIQAAVENRDKRQSGDGVGPHTAKPRYPATVSVRFNPNFKRRPVVVYGLKTLDSASNRSVRVHAEIVE